MLEGDEETDLQHFHDKFAPSRYGQKASQRWADVRSDKLKHRAITGRSDKKRPEKTFTHLRDGGEFSDALIHVGTVAFPVHRNILSCCSPYFRALFTNQLSAAENNRPSLTEAFTYDGQLSTDKTLTIGEDRVWEQSCPINKTPRPEPRQMDCIKNTKSQREAMRSNCNDYDEQNKDIRTNDGALTNQQRNQLKQQNERNAYNQIPLPATMLPPQRPRIQGPPHDTPEVTSSPTNASPAPRASRSVFSQHRRARVPCFQVYLEDVTADTVDSIIEHAYGGHVIITCDNVEQLLVAADRFQVQSLLKQCCDFLLNEINVGNCISIVKFSSRFFTCDTLRKTATRYVLDNFTFVFQTSPEFERLSQQELTAILCADQLNVKHEETVLDAIIRWVLTDVSSRQELIPELVRCVRVGLMLPENMKEFVDSWLVSSNLNSEFNQVTLQVMESVLQSQKQQMTVVDGAMFSPRLPRDILFVIGGSNFGFPLNLVEAFDCRTFGWSVICPYDFAPRSYHGMVALNKDIYVIGGFSGHVYLSSCCKLRADSLTWENVTPMNTKRCYVGAVVVKGSIYTIGGYDGVYRLNSAERFSTGTNQWSFIAPMMQQRSDAGVAVLNDKVYVCGGFNGMECIRSVELYDPDLDAWTAVPSMPRGRSGLGVACYNGCLYAVGGFDGVDSSVRLAVVESYNPETCQWTELQPMAHPRSNLAVEVLEDLLYAIGGFCGDRTTSAVECYDFQSNVWFESGQLSHNRSALSACVVSGLPNTADILQRTGPERCSLMHLGGY